MLSIIPDHPPIGFIGGFAALFFDSYGNLWGSGGENSVKYLYQFSTFTGQIITKLPILYDTQGSVDGCSCPGAFNFQKTALPEQASHCGSLDFIFTISNRTGQIQAGIQLEDWMPDGVNPLTQHRTFASGVYVWIAEIVYPDGLKKQLRGDVTVLR